MMNTLRIFAWAKGCDLADSLLSGSEAGLLHLRAISRVVGRKIRVWDSAGEILGIFESTEDKNNCSKPVTESTTVRHENEESRNVPPKEVELIIDNSRIYHDNIFTLRNKISSSYLELQYQYFENGGGHWIAKNNRNVSKRDNYEFTDNNDCLFEAVSQQCREYSPKMLRFLTAEIIRRQDTIMEKIYPQFQGAGILLLGGAKYNGTSAGHAKEILDNSQGSVGHGHVARAHPRGHSSHPSAIDYIDCVENYSRNATTDFPKSAWMSREEQDNDMHRLLISQKVQRGIEQLNEGKTRVVIKMDLDFEIVVGLWAEGVMFSGPWKAEKVTILLQHHNLMINNVDADVQVFTCYPEAPKESERQHGTIPRKLSLKRNLPESADNENEGIENKIIKFSE